MDLEFYFLKGSKGQIITPDCMRVRMSLNHLDIHHRPIGLGLANKEEVKIDAGVSNYPFIVDDKWIIQGSWNIACFLERNYVHSPTLLGGEFGLAHLKFMDSWVDGILIPNILVFIIKDYHDQLSKEDQPIFRLEQEARFKKELEIIQLESLENLEVFRTFLYPLRVTLAAQPFFSGNRVSYADFIIFSAFKWASSISPLELLDKNDILYGWYCEMDHYYTNFFKEDLIRKSS